MLLMDCEASLLNLQLINSPNIVSSDTCFEEYRHLDLVTVSNFLALVAMLI